MVVIDNPAIVTKQNGDNTEIYIDDERIVVDTEDLYDLADMLTQAEVFDLNTNIDLHSTWIVNDVALDVDACHTLAAHIYHYMTNLEWDDG